MIGRAILTLLRRLRRDRQAEFADYQAEIADQHHRIRAYLNGARTALGLLPVPDPYLNTLPVYYRRVTPADARAADAILRCGYFLHPDGSYYLPADVHERLQRLTHRPEWRQ